MLPVTDSIKWERVTDKVRFFSVVENMGRSRKVNGFVDWCLGDTGKCCNWWMNSALGIGLLKPQPLRTLEEIRADTLAPEKETEGLLGEIIGAKA
jgi:hypothetical protein